MSFVRLWCEWDIGQENLVFKSAESANTWIRNNSCIKEMASEAEMSVDDYVQSLIDLELIDTTPLEII